MPRTVPTATKKRKAKRFRQRSGNPVALSPTLAEEIGTALEALRGSRKAEGAAWDMGWSQTTWYERVHSPLSLSVAELLILLVKSPDARFNARIRGHLAAIDAYQAVAEQEAGATYLRITHGPGQRPLPFESEQ